MPPRVLSALAAAALLGACDKDGTSIGRFTVEEDIPETRVQGGGFGALLPGSLAPFQLDIESDEEFTSERFSVVNAIRVTRIVLSITEASEDTDTDLAENGMPDDFSFIDSLALSIEATFDGERRVAELASVDADHPGLAVGSRRLSLDTSDINILDFVEAEGGYRLVSSATGSPPPDDVVFDGSVDYRVNVGFR